MKIFLTGGSGFIGRNLAECLKQKYELLAPGHKELELLDENAVRSYLQAHKPDVIIHSAVRPGHRNARDPSRQLYNNLRMFFNIIRNRGYFGKMIFLSSGAVYDVSRPLVKVSEDFFDTYIPGDEHGFSKYIIAKQIEKLENIVELRIFGIFGKYEDYAIRFISNAICKAIFDLPITAKQNRKFDYVYIEDFMRIIPHFIENETKYNCYNITPDASVELYKLAEEVIKISGKKLPIKVAKEGMCYEYSGDNARLRSQIPGFNFSPIGKSIGELYSWYLENKVLINRESLLSDK